MTGRDMCGMSGMPPVGLPNVPPAGGPPVGIPGAIPGSPHALGAPMPAGVAPIPAPSVLMQAVAAPAGAPTHDPSGAKAHYFNHMADQVPRAYNQATVDYFGLKPFGSTSAGGPVPSATAGIGDVLARLTDAINALKLLVGGSPAAFGGGPGKPGQNPGQFALPGGGPFAGPTLIGGPGFFPGSPASIGAPKPAGVTGIPGPPMAMDPVAAPAGAPTTDAAGGKLAYYNHIGDRTPRAYNDATVKYFGLRTA